MFFWTVSELAHFVLAGSFSLLILHTKHRPVSAVLWIGSVWIFPLAGGLLYLVFGIDTVSRSAAQRAVSNEIVAAHLVTRFGDGAQTEGRQRPIWPSEFSRRAGYLFAPSPGNRCDLLVDGDQFYPELFDAIDNAEESVHVQSFIIRRDSVGRALVERLINGAKNGIETRLLYDRFGSTTAHFTNFFHAAKRAGVGVHSISQVNPLKGHLQMNLRNHRKVAVIDGRIGFVGGINFGDENLTTHTSDGAIRDYHLRIEGPAVRQLQIQFVQDWYFVSAEPVEQLCRATLFPETGSLGPVTAQVVCGGPDRKHATIADVVFALATNAEHSLTLITPYFVPDEPTFEAVRHAALKGVKVRLVVPARGNHFYAELAGRSLYGQLLEAGVRIFERAKPFLHAKAILVDDTYSVLGSPNIDYRSLHLNFETAVVLQDPRFQSVIAAQIEREITLSRELEPARHATRGFGTRLAENVCYLFQPLL